MGTERLTRYAAHARGLQLAGMRVAAGVTQAEVAGAMGISQARVSKIEHGEIASITVVRAYVAALGGTVHFYATFDDDVWSLT